MRGGMHERKDACERDAVEEGCMRGEMHERRMQESKHA